MPANTKMKACKPEPICQNAYLSSPFSHNGSPMMAEEDHALILLKQFYLEAILEIDPIHPLGANAGFVSCVCS
jgi:hypothetical protein